MVLLFVCIFVWHIRRIQINKPYFLRNRNSLHIVLKPWPINELLQSKTIESSYSNRQVLILMDNPEHFLLPMEEILLLICHNLSLIHPLLKVKKNQFTWNQYRSLYLYKHLDKSNQFHTVSNIVVVWLHILIYKFVHLRHIYPWNVVHHWYK